MFSPAKTYLQCRGLSLPFALINTVAIGAFRGLLDTTTPLRVIVLINVVNFILDPILIFGFSGAPGSVLFGTGGAAAATTISEVLGSIVFIGLLRERGMFERDDAQDDSLVEFSGMKDLLAGGTSQILRTISLQFVLVSAAAAAAGFDADAAIHGSALHETAGAEGAGGVFSASHNILCQVWWTSLFCLDAIAVAAQGLVASALNEGSSLSHDDSIEHDGNAPISSSTASARNIVRARAICDRCLVYGFAAGCVMMLLILVLRWPIAASFGHEASLVTMTANTMIIVALLQPLNGLVFVGDGIFQGALDFSYLAIAMSLASAVALLVLGSIKVMSAPSFSMIWIAITVLQCGRALGLGWRYFNKKRGPLAIAAHTEVDKS